jgi:hypothetical protein
MYSHKIFSKLAFISLVTLSSLFSASAYAAPGSAGWQGKYVYTVPTGQVDLFFHYPCPSSAPIPINGGFLPNLAAKVGLQVLGNSLIESSDNQWGWIIDWPAGAKPGSTITFDVYCSGGPA